jgi:hypothetical protein
MQLLCSGWPTFVVASIYCAWRFYFEKLLLRQRQLRQRVAYMLWVAANQLE